MSKGAGTPRIVSRNRRQTLFSSGEVSHLAQLERAMETTSVGELADFATILKLA
jgi:hypothetical protein